jgi:hypothetical protein
MSKFSISIVGTEEVVLVQTISGSISILESKDARVGVCVGTYEKVGSTYVVKVATSGCLVPLEQTAATVVDAADACLQMFYAQRAMLMFCTLAAYIYPAIVAAKQDADTAAAAAVAVATKTQAQAVELGKSVIAVTNYRYVANQRLVGCFVGGIFADQHSENGTIAETKVASVILAIDGTYTFALAAEKSQAIMNAEDCLGSNAYFSTAEQAADAAILQIKG